MPNNPKTSPSKPVRAHARPATPPAQRPAQTPPSPRPSWGALAKQQESPKKKQKEKYPLMPWIIGGGAVLMFPPLLMLSGPLFLFFFLRSAFRSGRSTAKEISAVAAGSRRSSIYWWGGAFGALIGAGLPYYSGNQLVASLQIFGMIANIFVLIMLAQNLARFLANRFQPRLLGPLRTVGYFFGAYLVFTVGLSPTTSTSLSDMLTIKSLLSVVSWAAIMGTLAQWLQTNTQTAAPFSKARPL